MRLSVLKKIIYARHGQSLIEVIIAMAIFSIMVSSITGLVLGGQAMLAESGRRTEAAYLAGEGLEAVRVILRNNWSKGTLHQSAVALNKNEWVFAGEGTSEQIGQFLRTIYLYPIFRDGEGEITASTTPAAREDVQSKRVAAIVTWPARNGKQATIRREAYFTNWPAGRIVQTDWYGGGGQTITGIEDQYESDDGNVVVSDSVALKEIATSTFALGGSLVSSAFPITPAQGFTAIEWDESVPAACALCDIRFQLKFASDNSGSPGEWTAEWMGPGGDDGDANDYFTAAQGELIPADLSDRPWVKYKVYLDGDGAETPVLEEVRIMYRR